MGASAVVSKAPSLPLWSEEPIRFTCILMDIGISLTSWKWFEKPIVTFGNRIVSKNPQNIVADDRGLNDRVGAATSVIGRG